MKKVQLLMLLMILSFFSCKKEDVSTNYGVDGEGNTGNNGNQDELKADFTLFGGYTPIAGCAMYLDTVTITATNNSEGAIVSYDWSYQVNDSRYWIGVPETEITQANWSRTVDLILGGNLLKDSTFVKVSLTVADSEGNTSTKSQILAYDMMSPFGSITFDGTTYDIGAVERVLKFSHRNEEQSNGECLIKIQDSNNDDNVSFNFLLFENVLNPIREISVTDGNWNTYTGDETTLVGNIFGTQERSDVLKSVAFSGTVRDDWTGIEKSISVSLNWLVAGKTLGTSTLPDCKLD